jgi:small subunit ribosomal protein S6
MNIECDGETLAELEHSFKFNDAVLRHLTIKADKAETAPSPMMKEEKSRSFAAPSAPTEAKPVEVAEAAVDNIEAAA